MINLARVTRWEFWLEEIPAAAIQPLLIKGQSELDRNSRVKEWKGCADTTILLSSSLVGLREVFSKLEIISEKWEENGRRWSSVTNTSVFCIRLLEDVIVWRFTAATTGKRDHTSLWNSIKQLWTVCLP